MTKICLNEPKKQNYWNYILFIILINVFIEIYFHQYFFISRKLLFFKIQVLKKFLKLINMPFLNYLNYKIIMGFGIYLLMIKGAKYLNYLLIPFFFGIVKTLTLFILPYINLFTCIILFFENIHPTIIFISLISPFKNFHLLIFYIFCLKYVSLLKLNSKQMNVIMITTYYLTTQNIYLLLILLPFIYQTTSKYINYFFKIFIGIILVSYSIVSYLNQEKVYFSTSIPLIFVFIRYK